MYFFFKIFSLLLSIAYATQTEYMHVLMINKEGHTNWKFHDPKVRDCSSTRSYSEHALVSLKVFSRSRHISDKLMIYAVMINKNDLPKL